MATIKYDGISSPSNLVTFTEVPNLLKVSETMSGEKAHFMLDIVGDFETVTSADTQWYITFFGDTITNVIDPKNANSKRFYGSSDEASTAFSIARALRGCPKISTVFDIVCDGTEINIFAKTIGKKWNNINDVMFTNIPGGLLERSIFSDGTSSSDLFDSKIIVDVYTQENYSGTFDKYVTSFEKNLLTDSVSFNLSPLLATITNHGASTPYQFDVSAIKSNGIVDTLGSISANSIVGFSTEGSLNYMYANNTSLLARNAGALYIYDKRLDFSVIQGASSWTYNIKYYTSLGALIDEFTYYDSKSEGNLIKDKSYPLPDTYFDRAAYLTLKAGSSNEQRYDIIKPLKMSEGNTRVYWRNCYGGISFFDFTSTKSDSTEVEIESYEKNIFDFYQTTDKEKKKIYSNNFSKTFKLTSHLFKEDGRWIFDDMMKSKKLWIKGSDNTIVYIIPKSIEIEENATYNGLFTAKFSYTLSY